MKFINKGVIITAITIALGISQFSCIKDKNGSLFGNSEKTTI